MPESGPDWVNKFPTSKSLDDLELDFRAKAKAFVAALTAAGATITISATVRPRQRAYLMHHCWMISKGKESPASVPAFIASSGELPVDIQWVHKRADGSSDPAASKQAAIDMVAAYGMTKLRVAPALASNHIFGKAMDMSVGWSKTLSIKNNAGKTVAISSAPRSSTNPDLIKVAKTYGVIHLVNVDADPPHWSFDGR